jgi:hypothetical protein
MERNYWIVYVAFFGLIGFALYTLHSAWPLLALIATPSYESKNNNKNENE